jgi:hypothetical protein
MSKILKVSESDYRLKVVSGGNITLDTGANTGVVTITGSLVVQGDYTTVNVSDLQIEDNTILLNKGETGVGVTEGTAGIQIDRGSLNDSRFVWDEALDKFSFQTVTSGVIPVATLAGINVASIATDPTTNLEFDMQSGGGTLRITNSTGYESRVTDPDDIPNKKYVNDYVYASGGSAQVDRIKFPVTADFGFEDSLLQALSTSFRFYIKSGGTLFQRAQITTGGLDIDNINIFEDTITNTGIDIALNPNLRLTSVNNNVEIDAVLNLNDQISTPAATGGTSRIFSKSSAGPGKSGVFFANNIATDELVSKNRAVLLSILF